MIKCLIIDDERLARKAIADLLEDYSDITVCGEGAHADEGKKLIHQLKPDLVFLDIQMPEKDGFQLLEELDYLPYVVFVTAHDNYALKAFEVSAVDYLLKPVEQQRFDQCIQRVLQALSQSPRGLNDEQGPATRKTSDRVFVKDGNQCWFVAISTIGLIESEGNYARIHFDQQKPLIHRSLNQLEERLPSTLFFRANRNQIINLEWIEKIDPWYNGGLKISLKGGAIVEVSRRKASQFKEALSL